MGLFNFTNLIIYWLRLIDWLIYQTHYLDALHVQVSIQNVTLQTEVLFQICSLKNGNIIVCLPSLLSPKLSICVNKIALEMRAINTAGQKKKKKKESKKLIKSRGKFV